MSDNRSPDELSVEELQELLYRKKRAYRRQRLQRLSASGRVVDIAGLPAPNPEPPPLQRPRATPTGALRQYSLGLEEGEAESAPGEAEGSAHRPIRWRWVLNTILLLIEISAVTGLAAVLLGLWSTRQELNQELAQVQRQESQSLALPTATATPVIDVVVLPSGHKPPVAGRAPEQGEAGDIPAHLLPAINAYVPPPIPTPGVEQARRIQIPAIDVDSPIFQGDDWDQLKKGVGQHISSALPGENGNLVLSAHNDIYGEIFRYLNRLAPGDEIIVSTERQSYTYVVRKVEIVKPTDVWVMAPTEHASSTLISCYPYQVNNQRIVVFADLATAS
jgi:sortase A